jgi:hypothetical protein
MTFPCSESSPLSNVYASLRPHIRVLMLTAYATCNIHYSNHMRLKTPVKTPEPQIQIRNIFLWVREVDTHILNSRPFSHSHYPGQQIITQRNRQP